MDFNYSHLLAALQMVKPSAAHILHNKNSFCALIRGLRYINRGFKAQQNG